MPSFVHSDAVRPGARARNAARHGPPRGLRLTASLLILACLCALGLASCTSTRSGPKPSSYGAIFLPPDAKTIGLTVARPCPEFTLNVPASKHDAAREVAAGGAREMARDPYAAIHFPIGYVLGGIMGGMLGVSETELKSSTRTLTAVVQELHFDEGLVQILRSHLSTIHSGPILALADNLPMEPAATQGRMRREDHSRLVWEKPRPPAHTRADTGTDTVLGLHVTYLGFQARSNPQVHSTGDMEKLNPPLTLVLMAEITAVRVRNWADLGAMTVRYESTSHKFTEWAAGDAQPLRRELEAGRQEISRQIARQITRGPAPAGSTSTSTSTLR